MEKQTAIAKPVPDFTMADFRAALEIEEVVEENSGAKTIRELAAHLGHSPGFIRARMKAKVAEGTMKKVRVYRSSTDGRRYLVNAYLPVKEKYK